jgi:glutamate-ammonia-ligase adenylyltransferase
VSLSRLADRQHLSEADLTGLSSAYEFLRRSEHILQMENGLQTHTVPDETEKRALIARRVEFAGGGDFESSLQHHTKFVHGVFERVFGEHIDDASAIDEPIIDKVHDTRERIREHLLTSIAKSDAASRLSSSAKKVLDRVIETSPHFASLVASNPQLATQLAEPNDEILRPNYLSEMSEAVESSASFSEAIAAMRKRWHRHLIEIVVADIYEKVTITEAKRLQTELAEASIEAALKAVNLEAQARDIAILALGKLGGRGVDYDSDLDLIFVHDDDAHSSDHVRVVESFITALSSMTRNGSLYRVDLRLRPYGSKGLTCIPANAFLEYMRETAVTWEFLAFVKLRAAGGNLELAKSIETETRRIIHERAAHLDDSELAAETRRVRLALEQQRTRNLRAGEIDIKYGAGGLLDIYFAMRYLQLRDNVPDDAEDRSTRFMLDKLLTNGSISAEDYSNLNAGHHFLSMLDHNIRLIAGRSTRLSQGNDALLETIAKRMNLSFHAALIEDLTQHRLAIRTAFDAITNSAI